MDGMDGTHGCSAGLAARLGSCHTGRAGGSVGPSEPLPGFLWGSLILPRGQGGEEDVAPAPREELHSLPGEQPLSAGSPRLSPLGSRILGQQTWPGD